jgi:hypothetical protein
MLDIIIETFGIWFRLWHSLLESIIIHVSVWKRFHLNQLLIKTRHKRSSKRSQHRFVCFRKCRLKKVLFSISLSYFTLFIYFSFHF